MRAKKLKKNPKRPPGSGRTQKKDKNIQINRAALNEAPAIIKSLLLQIGELERGLEADQVASLILRASDCRIIHSNAIAQGLLGIKQGAKRKTFPDAYRFFSRSEELERLAGRAGGETGLIRLHGELKSTMGRIFPANLVAKTTTVARKRYVLLSFAEGDAGVSNERLLQNYYGKIMNLERALNESNLVSVTDAQGVIIYANSKFCAVSKYSRDELLGQNHRIVNSGFHSKAFFRLLWKTITAGEVWHGEIRNRAKDGSLYWVNSTIVPFFDKHNKPYQFFAIRQDITERKKVALDLERSREALVHAQELARLGSWEWLAAEDRAVWSEELYRIYGVEPGAPPLTFKEIPNYYTPESWVALSSAVAQTLQEGKPFSMECDIARKDGSRLVIIATGAPMLDANNKIIGIRGTVQDVTEQKRIEERNRLIVNALPDLIFVLNRHGEFLDYHASEPKRLAYKPEFFLGKSFREIFDPVLAEKMTGALDRVSGGSMLESIEYTLPLGENTGHFEAAFTPLDRDRIMIVVRDTTERRLNDTKLRESEQNLAVAQRIAGIGSWHWNIPSNKLSWSAEVFRIFGVSPGAFEGTLENFLQMVHPDDRQKVQDGIAGALAGRPHFELDHRIVRPDGAVLLVHEMGEVTHDSAGSPETIAGTVQDITQRALAEQKMREQATLLDNARDAILVRSLDHIIEYWNRGAEQMYGWPREEVMGKSIRSLLYASAEIFDAATTEVLTHGEFSGELEQLTRDGRTIIVQARWTLLRDEAGKPKSVFAINTDITERKNLEQQFLRAQRLESIGTLAGGIAHDLNNVLTPIMLAAEVLKMGDLAKDQLELIAMIESSVKHGTRMVRQVLSFARGAEGNPVPLRLGTLAADLEPIIKDTFPKNISLSINVAEDLWLVKADFTQLHQVLMNLAVNARDAMPQGGRLAITAQNRVLDPQYAGMQIGVKPGNYVLIEVEDSGTGMSGEILERIYEPFFTTKDHGKGTGLGLSTSLAIIKAHGGFIRVYSEPGQGTKFHIYLPALGSDSRAPELIDEHDVPRGNGELILVVDDEPAVLAVTQQTLNAFGYNTKTARDGAEAIVVYSQFKDEIALVVTDMMMPVLDGVGEIRVLLKMRADLPIIAVSGLDTQSKTLQLQGLNSVSFLQKPYAAPLLLRTIRNALIVQKK